MHSQQNPMTESTANDCSEGQNSSPEQHDARVLRRWTADPYGRFDACSSNYRQVEIALEWMIGRWLRMAADATLHEYWCDGIVSVVHDATENNYRFAGACTLSDHHANTMWLAPFELQIAYPSDCDWPSTASLRIGHRDAEQRFDRSLRCGRECRLQALAHWIYGARPLPMNDWAISLAFEPFPRYLGAQRSSSQSVIPETGATGSA